MIPRLICTKRLLVIIKTNLILNIVYKYTKILQLFTSNVQNKPTNIVYKCLLKMPIYECLGCFNFNLIKITAQKFLSLSLNYYVIY